MKSLRDFGLGKPKVMDAIMEEEMSAIVQHIESCIGKQEGILEMDAHILAASAINILWRIVGGFRFPLDDEKLKQSIQFNDDIIQIVGHKNLYTVFPFLKTWFPKSSQFKNHMEINHTMQNFIHVSFTLGKT